MQPSPVHVWLQIITLPLNSSKSSPISSKHQFEQISMSRALSADFDSIWTSVLVWEGGSMVKRITQNSPTRCSLAPCQLFSSIRPSIVSSFAPSSFHLPVCLSLSVLLFPSLSRRLYCASVSFPYPSPLFSLYLHCFPSKLLSSHLAVRYPNHLSQSNPHEQFKQVQLNLKTLAGYLLTLYSSIKLQISTINHLTW